MNTRTSVLIGLMLFCGVASVAAHEGHEDATPPAPVGAYAPQRQADGSVFLPKPAQRQMDVRTVLVAQGEAARALELNGKVVMDPNAGGLVQTIVAGRLTPGPKGLPLLGQRVQRGEVLAYVTPAAGDGTRSLAVSRLQRLRELADTVPRKTLEEAAAAVANEEMRAPVSGVIAATYVVGGQVVDARETLFEIVDPTRVQIEALAYDMANVADIRSAAAVVNGVSVPLQFIGASRRLREQALPVLFRATGVSAQGLAVGQPLRVIVRTGELLRGVPVPAAALEKNAANQTVVWVKTAAERFEPRVLVVIPLDGTQVLATAGLNGGERIVVKAAALLNQVR